MTSLTVIAHPKNGTLVVDSRLIADELGIQHKTFIKTIRKYQTKIEARFGEVSFEVEPDNHAGSGNYDKVFCYLTEDQSTFIMTLSRNTDRVIDCKLDLVESFSKAKQLIQSLSQQKSDRIAAKSVPNYKPAREKCLNQLKRHGANGMCYGKTEAYNNALNEVPNGGRHEVTYDQANGLIQNYLFAAIELAERESGFANHPNHLANTACMAMRHGKQKICGVNSVPDRLKPKRDRLHIAGAK